MKICSECRRCVVCAPVFHSTQFCKLMTMRVELPFTMREQSGCPVKTYILQSAGPTLDPSDVECTIQGRWVDLWRRNRHWPGLPVLELTGRFQVLFEIAPPQGQLDNYIVLIKFAERPKPWNTKR